MKELIQPERVETLVAEMPQEKAIVEVGEASTLPDLPKDMPSLAPQSGKETLLFEYFSFTVMADVLAICRGY